MKKIIYIILAVIFALSLFGCEKEKEEVVTEEAVPVATPTPTPEPVYEKNTIALMYGEDDAYYTAFKTQAEITASEMGYDLVAVKSENDAAQSDDMYMQMAKGVKAIILVPINMDNLTAATDDCALRKIPVVNLMVPVNGVVSTLVSPDYKNIGKLAAISGANALGETQVNALLIEAASDSFIGQMMHDGFEAAAKELDINIASAALINETEEAAKEEITYQLKEHPEINFIFLSDEVFAGGAVSAVSERAKDIKIACVGGSKAVMESIKNSQISAGISVSPCEAAKEAVKAAVNAAAGREIEQYIGVRAESINLENIDSYMAFGDYADSLAEMSLAEENRIKKAEELKKAEEQKLLEEQAANAEENNNEQE